MGTIAPGLKLKSEKTKFGCSHGWIQDPGFEKGGSADGTGAALRPCGRWWVGTRHGGSPQVSGSGGTPEGEEAMQEVGVGKRDLLTVAAAVSAETVQMLL